MKQVAQFARLVAKKNVTNIPYGFRYRRGCLTTEGQYAHEENSGLTCATFVLAIFHTLGVEILSDRAQQPTLAGVLWQERVADHFSGFYPDIGSALKAQVGVPRFEPEEVAAGAGQSKRPLAQERAVEIGKSIREQLRQHRLRQEAIEAGAASLTGRGQVSES